MAFGTFGNIRLSFHPSCQKPDEEYSTTTGGVWQEVITNKQIVFYNIFIWKDLKKRIK